MTLVQILYFLSGLFVGIVLGGVAVCLCVVSGNADRVSQEWLDRQEGET